MHRLALFEEGCGLRYVGGGAQVVNSCCNRYGKECLPLHKSCSLFRKSLLCLSEKFGSENRDRARRRPGITNGQDLEGQLGYFVVGTAVSSGRFSCSILIYVLGQGETLQVSYFSLSLFM